MVMTDPIADMLTRIRNANMVRHEKLEVPASNLKKKLLKSSSAKVSYVTSNLSKTTNKVSSVSS